MPTPYGVLKRVFGGALNEKNFYSGNKFPAVDRPHSIKATVVARKLKRFPDPQLVTAVGKIGNDELLMRN